MIASANMVVLLATTFLTVFYYIKSAGPAALEQKIGTAAYGQCTRYRAYSAIFMTLAGANYVVYAFYPIAVPLPRTFPWPYWGSAVIAVVIAVPAGLLWVRGMRDAGEETMLVKKEHQLYGGIYRKIRHPQAAGEVWYWWVFAFLCHSPFLALYSLVWLPPVSLDESCGRTRPAGSVRRGLPGIHGEYRDVLPKSRPAAREASRAVKKRAIPHCPSGLGNLRRHDRRRTMPNALFTPDPLPRSGTRRLWRKQPHLSNDSLVTIGGEGLCGPTP
jgi:protein-S-isoprenylcysteine O-methyltransferase Ste14